MSISVLRVYPSLPPSSFLLPSLPFSLSPFLAHWDFCDRILLLQPGCSQTHKLLALAQMLGLLV